jgi:hypothetical protein
MKKELKHIPGNQDKQGTDKDPAEEHGKKEKVTQEDLKGKKVDADPSDPRDQPLDTKEKRKT